MKLINRRSFLTGAAGLSMAASPWSAAYTRAQARPTIKVETRTIEVLGKAVRVFGLNGPSGKPGVDLVLGERFQFRLENQGGEDTLIHWHGLTPPIEQDGVPILSQPPLPAGQSYDYDFINTRAGTHWMHSHMGLQEQRLLAAPLIVRETAEPVFDEQEHVVMLHDFTFRDPAEILAELTGGGGNHAGHSAGGGMGEMDHSAAGGGTMMGGMLNDVTYDAYLANDRTLEDPEVVVVEKGGRIRLRIINAAAASNMWIDLGALEGELIAVDGNAIHPVRGSRFPLAVAQRADIRLGLPAGGGSYPVLFLPEGTGQRAGIVLATAGAAISRLTREGEAAAAVDLSQELIYRAVAELPHEPVTRTEMLMLTGGGADYVWGLNGKSGMHDVIFTVRQGERIAVMMHNMTMMAHPMHLHGHYFKVVAIGDRAIDGALRDVVLVPPMETVTVVFDADNPGTWAFHCHHAYHMASGMMGTIAYTSAA